MPEAGNMKKERTIDLFDAYIFDMDGVLYLRDQPIGSAVRFIALLRQEEKQVLFLTNNSKYSVEYYRRKLKRMGIAAGGADILTSSLVLREYLEEKHRLTGKTAFVIGGRALELEVDASPLELVRGEEGKQADFVVVGWDTHITYEKLKVACLAIFNGAAFIATNDDATFPTPEGKWPGAGAMVGALERSTGKRPVVVGKPNLYMMEAAMRRLDAKKKRTLMIGDRIETDVLGGRRAGMKTCLVLTGISGREDMENARPVPDYVVGDLSELAQGGR
jgi:HAD superfamily hydrolase (TIGR01457 family)